ncbi:MAG TPA: hypothetical protein VEW69_10240 [Alphaproteobacteria bacterium]|nr:hypothetical protein [Alphaproteobacteria bacterium]
MSRDKNGRVGPPRCQECNAPLSSDDALMLAYSRVRQKAVCLECQMQGMDAAAASVENRAESF